MRWDGLFADLEAQAAALERAERAGEVDERTRGEVGALTVTGRLRASTGLAVRARVSGAGVIAGTLARVGPDWALLDEGGGRETVVSLAWLLGVRGLARFAEAPGTAGAVESRLGLRHVLRGIARDRAGVRLHLADGSVVDATLDRIGADFVEAATHAPGEARRRQDVRDVELVPLRAIAVVRRSG